MILDDPEATARFGAKLGPKLRTGDVITMSGPLGAGKTSLARGILAGLGHSGEVPSPTFAIVQPYEDLQPPVWHVDLFRIENTSELQELGLDAAAEGVLLVEWPEKAGVAAWPEALRLRLDFSAGTSRRLTAKVPSSWQSRWPPQ